MSHAAGKATGRQGRDRDGRRSGIGAETARAFALHGAKVLLTDSNAALGKSVAEEIAGSGGTAAFRSQDVRDEALWAKIVTQAEKSYGRLDILCNIAGISVPRSEAEHSDGRHRGSAAGGAYARAVEPHHGDHTRRAFSSERKRYTGDAARRRGLDHQHLLHLGIVGSHANAAYHASKGAVRLFSKAAAIQYAPDKISVNRCIRASSIRR